MSTSYTIATGDNLWKIVKNKFQNLKTETEIANMVNKIAKDNKISTPNTIFAGTVLTLDAAGSGLAIAKENKDPKPATEPKKESGKSPSGESAAGAATGAGTAAGTQADSVTDKKINVRPGNEPLHYLPSIKAYAKVSEPKESTSAEKPAETVVELNTAEQFDRWTQDGLPKLEKGETVDDFKFLGPEFAKDITENESQNAVKIYADGVQGLSEKYLTQYDKDGDHLISYEEFTEKELTDYLKAFPGTDKEALREQVKAQTRASFDLIANISGKDPDKIDAKEQAAVFALFDSDPTSAKMNGKIKATDYKHWSEKLVEGDQAPKLKTLFEYLFSEK